MRRRLVITLVMALTGAALITGCGKNNKSSKAKENNSQAGDEANNSANTDDETVAVDDIKAFEEQLDITIDKAYIDNIDSMYIVDDKIAEVNFIATNVNGDECVCTLRGTRDEEYVDKLYVAYDDMSEPVSIAGVIGDMAIDFCSSEEGEITVYSWNDSNIFYSFSCSESFSQMQIGEMLDSLMVATGFQTE